ncbi:MAG: hypothetical protein K2H44_04085 [Muribaculaceae bacterium]|nr:hypothetical protein [Muribaculaceae bacterium]
MHKITSLLFALAIPVISSAAETYTDTIDYKTEDMTESSASHGNYTLYYGLKYTKSGHTISFSSTKTEGIISFTDQELYLLTIEVEWASEASAGQSLEFYNKEFSGLSNFISASDKGSLLTTLTCEGASTTTIYNVTEPCYDFGMKSKSGDVFVKSITFTWGTELPSAPEPEPELDPDMDKIDFVSGNLSVDKDTDLEGKIYSDEYLTIEIGESGNAILTDDGLSFNGELTVSAIDGYTIKNIEVSGGEVETLDDWSALIKSGETSITLESVTVKLGYEQPNNNAKDGTVYVSSFPAEISLTHTGKQARFFYIFEESSSSPAEAPQRVRAFLPEQNPENWTEAENGKISITKSGTLHCYAANQAHSVVSEVKTTNVDVTTGIDEVIENGPYYTNEYYSLQGQYLGNDYNRLNRGIYILRKGESVSKVIK